MEELKDMSNKCILRQTGEGIVATIDERPKVGQWACSENVKNWSPFKAAWDLSNPNTMLCIASTILNVGKKLMVDYKGQIMGELVGKKKELAFNKEYDYTETETQVIIQL